MGTEFYFWHIYFYCNSHSFSKKQTFTKLFTQKLLSEINCTGFVLCKHKIVNWIRRCKNIRSKVKWKIMFFIHKKQLFGKFAINRIQHGFYGVIWIRSLFTMENAFQFKRKLTEKLSMILLTIWWTARSNRKLDMDALLSWKS